MSASSRGTRTYPLVSVSGGGQKTGDTESIETSDDIFEGINSALYERKRKDRTLEPATPSSLKSTLSLKLYSTQNDKSSGQPLRWRLELMRAHGLPKAPKIYQNASDDHESRKFDNDFGDAGARGGAKIDAPKLLCNVVCEVLWRGPADLGLVTGSNQASLIKDITEGQEECKNIDVALIGEDKLILPDVTKGKAAIRSTKNKSEGPKISKHKSRTKTTVVDSWVSLGCTGKKGIPSSSADDPRFGAKDTGDISGVFDLPPVWTCVGRKGQRGPPRSEEELANNPGDWMPRNYLSRPHAKAMQAHNGTRSLRFCILAQAVLCFLRIQKAALQNPNMSIIRRRKDIWRLLGNAEEEERRCMAREEKAARVFHISIEEEKYSLLVEQQVNIAKQFSSVMNLIQCPTRTLSRLRFYMGFTLEGGGMRVIAQDPVSPPGSNKSILELFIMPLIYPEDEDEMRRHVEAIAVVSRSHPVVTPVVELSIHTLKGFTAMGFAAFETRTAFTLVAKSQSETKPTLCEYLRDSIEIKDQVFFCIIVQLLEGLAALHSEGIIHRNFHKGNYYQWLT